MARSNTRQGTQPAQRGPRGAKHRDIELDDIFDESGNTVTRQQAQDGSVRLTDISEIVAKYSVVDRFFTPEEEAEQASAHAEAAMADEPEIDGDDEEVLEAPADDALSAAAQWGARARQAQADEMDDNLEDEPETMTDDDQDEFVAARAPRSSDSARHLMFSSLSRRPHEEDGREEFADDLQSNWRDTATDAFEEMRHPRQAIYPEYTSALKEAAPTPEAPPVVRRHKRALVHTVALCAALPVVAGVAFALTLYVQKDVKPTELWAWATASTPQADESAVASTQPAVEPAAPPSNTLMTAVPEGTAIQTPTVAPAEQAAAVSPETLAAPQAQSPTQAPQYSAPPAIGNQGSPATQYFMARLNVSDAEGTASQPIPLDLNVTRGRPEQRLRIRVSGIPDGGLLSAGRDLGNGEWRLRETDLENLTMTLPAGFSGEITLLAMVIDDATHIQAGAPSTLQVRVTPDNSVVEPASAPPDASAPSFATPDVTAAQQPARGTVVPQRSLFPQLNMQAPDGQVPVEGGTTVPETTQSVPAQSTAPDNTRVASTGPAAGALPQSARVEHSMSPEEVKSLIDKGERMMSLGDIASARLFFQRALQSGDPRAATALGRSYDPLVFGQLQVRGVPADPEQALKWYRQGVESGSPEAIAHLQALDAWLNQ